VEGRLWKICELPQQDNSIAAAPLGGLRDEGLAGVLAHVVLEIAHLVGEQEGIRHKLVINGEEALEPGDDDTENVLFCEVIHQRIPIEDALAHLYYVQVVVA